MGEVLGGYLRSQRKRAGLSAKQAEELSGVSKVMIEYVERGQREPSIELMVRMAVAVGVDDLTDLFNIYLTEQVGIAKDNFEAHQSVKCAEILSRWLSESSGVSSELKKEIMELVADTTGVMSRLDEIAKILGVQRENGQKSI